MQVKIQPAGGGCLTAIIHGYAVKVNCASHCREVHTTHGVSGLGKSFRIQRQVRVEVIAVGKSYVTFGRVNRDIADGGKSVFIILGNAAESGGAKINVVGRVKSYVATASICRRADRHSGTVEAIYTILLTAYGKITAIGGHIAEHIDTPSPTECYITTIGGHSASSECIRGVKRDGPAIRPTRIPRIPVSIAMSKIGVNLCTASGGYSSC